MIKVSDIKNMVALALMEDVGLGDVTASLLPHNDHTQADLFLREPCCLCGHAWVEETLKAVDPQLSIAWLYQEGDWVEPGLVAKIEGPLQSIVTSERVAINFLQTLSATATKTRQYVDAISGTSAKVLDTRKTLPLWRKAQKHAVRCGGGVNHRQGLYDAILIKENHWRYGGTPDQLVHQARENHPDLDLIVEVTSMEELKVMEMLGVDRILLDNFSIDQIKDAVAWINGRIPLEVSGGVTLANIRQYAECGVDFISVGALTKNIQAIDFSLQGIH